MARTIPDKEKIVFLPEERAVEIKPHATFLEIALKNRIQISHSCDGMGSCGTCLLRIEEGTENLEPRNEVEQEIADSRGLPQNERLACQTIACAPSVVTVLNPEEWT